MRNKITSIMSYAVHNNIKLLLIQETWIRKCDTAILTKIKEYGFDVKCYRKSLSIEWGGGVGMI